MIPVTKPFLPPQEEYQKYVSEIWKRNWLTNNGPLVNELELRLKDYLDVPHLLYVSNGTIALQLAIKALSLSGEIITTPFSYVATTSSIVWEGCSPVFVDIDADSFNIDPEKIEAAITERTSAILATHVYGNPCDIDAIQEIADRHDLKVIYDAAHCFGTTYKGKSVLEFGDVSAISFHATKLFHTIEGGAVVTKNPDLEERMALMRNFGHDGPEKFNGVGINGKNSEFHAAMGLCNLNYIEYILSKRKSDCLLFDQLLEGIPLKRPKITTHAVFNYAYYAVLFESEETCIAVVDALEHERVFPRRYFYPALSALEYVGKYSTPITDSVSKRVLCLPLYEQMYAAEIHMIVKLIRAVFSRSTPS